jgi:hypothetical protein
MKQKSIPGYRALFGEPFCSCECVLEKMPSSAVLSIAISINNELSFDMPYQKNQHRILSFMGLAYTVEQRLMITSQLQRLQQSGYNEEAYELFHRRYLIAIILKELQRNQSHQVYLPSNGGEFPFLIAYLMTIDEEHAKDQPILAKSLVEIETSLSDYNMIWSNFIRQYQFNESSSPSFEFFKLFVLCKFAYETWRPNLKEYLFSFGFDSIGKLAGSYKQIFDALQLISNDAHLKKLVWINPNPGVTNRHLESMCINSQMGNSNTGLLDLKKRPLLFSALNGYRVIDHNFLYKHIFKGPFFDLNKNTSLKDVLPFPDYSVMVSKKVMEEVCFKVVLEMLQQNTGTLIPDNGKDSAPDGYYRDDNIIFLIEFKAYVLNDSFASTPNFEKFKKYIEENFIKKANGKPKGAGQIINQMKLLKQGKLNTDIIHKLDGSKKYIIYPIICHNDFHFSLPAINEFINASFIDETYKNDFDCFEIKNLTLINLDWLFDLCIRNGSFQKLKEQIDSYWHTLTERKTACAKVFDHHTYLNSKSSFDEMYQNTFIQQLPNVEDNMNKMNELLDRAGVTQSILNEVI